MAVLRGQPELIVVARSDAALRATARGLMSLAGADTTPLNDICARYGGTLAPLFGLNEDRLLRAAPDRPAFTAGPQLALYYRVDAPPERLPQLADELRGQPLVAAAYVKPPAEPPRLIDPPARAEEPPAATPDFVSRQSYLGPAPEGVDARRAWERSGGRGAGVRIIDVEGAWQLTHEDLTQNQGGVVGGTPFPDVDWRNHGTAVMGVIGGDDNGIGITGICPDANVSAISFNGLGTAQAIVAAANRLQPGDIILIELHRAGPRHNFETRDDQDGYIAIEWWPDDFDAIQFATRVRQVVVVEAAGNGSQDLYDPLYDARPAEFPENWINPFRRGDADSGAVLVGAGAPPPGTHGEDHGPDRSRLSFSNFGPVDAQGWGRAVTTCGYGDLQGGNNEDLWYTNSFSGTSSASPIIVGTLACVQGRRRAVNLPVLTSRGARDLLRRTGSFQQDAPGRPSTQRIGSRPDLRALMDDIESEATKLLKDAKDKESTKETHEKPKERSKEYKDKDKEVKDFEKDPHRELMKVPVELGHGGIGPGEGVVHVAARLAGLEQTVARLVHFIDPSLRPDLSVSALRNEEQPDRDDNVRALSARLRRNAEEAKAAKDGKDLEKPSER
ncbi:Subtilase family protein [Micromonospora viridifaciens]|uniref:Subtilase family protein n=1 Tax=Micromonospora viridifaciens TaxID=1881 RepID=A0A1C4X1P9_MICVI|nr:S8 family peptidase [Micromonospora viridifaciens]SCF02417.1 Subtilase family protein [Micromonospora viridifaciens]